MCTDNIKILFSIINKIPLIKLLVYRAQYQQFLSILFCITNKNHFNKTTCFTIPSTSNSFPFSFPLAIKILLMCTDNLKIFFSITNKNPFNKPTRLPYPVPAVPRVQAKERRHIAVGVQVHLVDGVRPPPVGEVHRRLLHHPGGGVLVQGILQ